MARKQLRDIRKHNSTNADDVHIMLIRLPAQKVDAAGYTFIYTSKCIFYRGIDGKVCVYISDSSAAGTVESLTDGEMEGFDTKKRPKTFRDHHRTSGIFSIAYATMLWFGVDPSKREIKSNKVHGDETLICVCIY